MLLSHEMINVHMYFPASVFRNFSSFGAKIKAFMGTLPNK